MGCPNGFNPPLGFAAVSLGVVLFSYLLLSIMNKTFYLIYLE